MTITKHLVRIGPLKDFIPSEVRVGDLVTVSGQVGVNHEVRWSARVTWPPSSPRPM
jgi:hypothetical protein